MAWEGSWAQHLGLEPASIQDSGTADRGLGYHATVQASQDAFLKPFFFLSLYPDYRKSLNKSSSRNRRNSHQKEFAVSQALHAYKFMAAVPQKYNQTQSASQFIERSSWRIILDGERLETGVNVSQQGAASPIRISVIRMALKTTQDIYVAKFQPLCRIQEKNSQNQSCYGFSWPHFMCHVLQVPHQ